MDMNYDLTTKGVEMFKEMLAKNQLDQIVRMETKALQKVQSLSPNSRALLKVVGDTVANKLLERGWEIMSHSPSNYAHAMPHYTLVKNRTQLAIDLDAQKA